jgi:hypothetical protein
MNRFGVLFFVLHLGIGGMCGFTDIKITGDKTVTERGTTFTTVKGITVFVAASMPYWIEDAK